MNKQVVFKKQHPNAFFVDMNDRVGLHNYLLEKNLIDSVDHITSVSVPGAGNMNCVIRIETSNQRFILKQARPWVEKYPEIAAPINRIGTEAAYYKAISSSEKLLTYSPTIILEDISNFILVMEDLGEVDDFSALYVIDKQISDDAVMEFADYLSLLHQIESGNFPENMAMRNLNHTHIFDLPFRPDSGLDLEGIQQGLQSLAGMLIDPVLQATVEKCGNLYLQKGKSLIHGDFYPGSLMHISGQYYVLDPEFSFFGPPEFDVGVFLAHLKLSHQPNSKAEVFIKTYKREINKDLVYSFAGIEIIRRLLGVAQLPLNISILEKKNLVNQAIDWLT